MSFHQALPQPWAAAAATLLLAILVGLLARLALMRVGLAVARRTPTDLDELLVRLSATPLALTIALAGAARAAQLVWPTRDLAIQRAFVSALIVVWSWAVARLVAELIVRSSRRLGGITRAHGAVLLARFTKVFVAVVVILTVLAVWGVSITPLIAGAGIAGIALALAAQDTLANLFAGVAIYMDRIYEVGDYIVLDQGSGEELRGEVQDVGLRSTRILTRDDIVIIVPNSVIANNRVVNESAFQGRYRVRVRVSVAYASDLDHVERVLTHVGGAHPKALRDPAARARIRSFGDSGVGCELLVWIADPSDRGIVVHELSKSIHARFREEGITIPFPQRVVHTPSR